MWRLLLLASLLSCAHTDSAEWVEESIPWEEEIWRNCSLEKDGPTYAGQGWCYQGQECQNRWYSKKKCRPKAYFCDYGDVDCMKRHKLDRKALIFHPEFQ